MCGIIGYIGKDLAVKSVDLGIEALKRLEYRGYDSSGFAFCLADDISGVWVGETEVPDQGPDELTLILEKAGDSYTGTISDSFGMLVDAECEDIEYNDNVLTFNFSIYDGYSSMIVYIEMNVEGDTMTGHWETEQGDTGEVNMVKKD